MPRMKSDWNYFTSSIPFGNVKLSRRKEKKSIFHCAHFCRGGEIARSERVKLDSVGRTAQFPLRGGYLETLERILLHDIVRNDVLSSRVGGMGQEQ